MLELLYIKMCAHGVRKWAKKHRVSYHCDSDDLCGMCAVASVKLHRILKSKKIHTKIVLNNEHCFLRYKNYIIDVTINQFSHDFGKIAVVPVPKNDMDALEYWWSHNKVFNSDQTAVKYQKKVGWPDHQIYDYKGESDV